MSPRRLNPRHVADVVQVAAFETAGDGISGTWAGPVPIKVQVESRQETVTTADDVRVVPMLTLRVPPKTAVDLETLFAPDSEVTYRGRTSWVLTCQPVERQGALSFMRVTTGDQRPAGGGWRTDVDILHSPGRDKDGVPVDGTVDLDVPAIVLPGTTSEPTDFADTVTSTAVVLLPATQTVRPTDRIRINDTPMQGVWPVDGDPTPDRGRLRVPIRRT